MLEWYENIAKHANENELAQVRTFTQGYKINARHLKIETMQQWICNAKKMTEKVEKLLKRGVRVLF